MAKVARIQPELTNVDPMADIGTGGDPGTSPATADPDNWQLFEEYGFNLDFAPVPDVLTNPDNKGDGDQAFARLDAAVVSQMVASARCRLAGGYGKVKRLYQAFSRTCGTPQGDSQRKGRGGNGQENCGRNAGERVPAFSEPE